MLVYYSTCFIKYSRITKLPGLSNAPARVQMILAAPAYLSTRISQKKKQYETHFSNQFET